MTLVRRWQEGLQVAVTLSFGLALTGGFAFFVILASASISVEVLGWGFFAEEIQRDFVDTSKVVLAWQISALLWGPLVLAGISERAVQEARFAQHGIDSSERDADPQRNAG